MAIYSEQASDAEKRLSIVVPTHNRYAQAVGALTALSDQILAHGLTSSVEVLLVDDGSEPQCVARVREFLRRQNHSFVRYLELPENCGAGAARNAGVAASGGAVIAFLDDDVAPSNDYVRTVIRAHERHPEALVINGNLRTMHGNVYSRFWFHQCNAVFNRAGEEFYTVEMLASGNVSMKRSVLARENPLFDVSLTAKEDLDLYLRLKQRGIPSYKDDSILAFNTPRSTLAGFLKQHAWYGRGQEQLIAKHGKAVGQMQASIPPNLRYLHLYVLIRLTRIGVRLSGVVQRRVPTLGGKRRVHGGIA